MGMKNRPKGVWARSGWEDGLCERKAMGFFKFLPMYLPLLHGQFGGGLFEEPCRGYMWNHLTVAVLRSLLGEVANLRVPEEVMVRGTPSEDDLKSGMCGKVGIKVP